MYEKIRQDLLNLQDKKYKEFHSSLCPGCDNIIGIKIPVLRDYAKKLSKRDKIKEYICFNRTKYYEEVMLQGMLIGLLKNTDIKEFLIIIKNFVPKIDNWAICDVFCAGLKTADKDKEIFWNFIKKYIKSKKEFELRFAIVMMLDHFMEDNYIDKVLGILDKINHVGYYVKMAVAWAISVAFVKFQDKTLKYLENNNLDDWTYNKALQKIRESLRVSDETKEKIKNMKR